MEIPKEQAEKLKRYFINADPFLFGVLEKKNKKERLKELKEIGFLSGYSDGSNATYSRMYQDLIVELGIEGIFERIVIPQVNKHFSPEVLRYFRRCWEQGQTPDMKYLKEHQLYQRRPFSGHEVYGKRDEPLIAGYRDPAHIFLQIDTQHYFVERWTVFGGLWFEEIEPIFNSVIGACSNNRSVELGKSE